MFPTENSIFSRATRVHVLCSTRRTRNFRRRFHYTRAHSTRVVIYYTYIPAHTHTRIHIIILTLLRPDVWDVVNNDNNNNNSYVLIIYFAPSSRTRPYITYKLSERRHDCDLAVLWFKAKTRFLLLNIHIYIHTIYIW